jgi:hypothetical protein
VGAFPNHGQSNPSVARASPVLRVVAHLLWCPTPPPYAKVAVASDVYRAGLHQVSVTLSSSRSGHGEDDSHGSRVPAWMIFIRTSPL